MIAVPSYFRLLFVSQHGHVIKNTAAVVLDTDGEIHLSPPSTPSILSHVRTYVCHFWHALRE